MTHSLTINTFTSFLYLGLPDTFISMTFTLKDIDFTNSLHDPNSDDYQTLSRLVKNNVSFTIVMNFIVDSSSSSPQVVQLAISQSPGSSHANPMLEGQEIWQHIFKLMG